MKKNKFNTNNIQDDINKYSSMSQDQLMEELIKHAKEGKQNGSINDATLEKLYNVASGFLKEDEKARLKSLLEIVKKS